MEFDGGQNYFVGANWQGKSSVVESIAFALFGADAFPRKLAGTAIKAEHLLTDRAERGEVELVFLCDEREYTVRRVLPRAEVSLHRDGTRIASGKRPVDEKLADLLAVDAKFFANVFYADQDELRKSFDLSPQDRRLFIERLIGQETWRERSDALRAAAKQVQDFVEDLQTGRFGVFVEQLDELSGELESGLEEIESLRSEIRALADELPHDRSQLRKREAKADKAIAAIEHRETALNAEQFILERLVRGLEKGKCPTCNQPLSPTLRRSRLAALRKQMRSGERAITAARRDLAKVQHDVGAMDFASANERFDDLTDLKARLETLDEVQRQRAQREKELRGKARVFGKKPEQHARALERIVFLDRLVAVIDQHRSNLRARVVAELVTAMNDLLSRFHDGDFDATAVVDSAMDLRAQLHEREVPLINLSGAAKDIFAIALRYGLMRVAARHVNCLILDEPTRHMDQHNVRQLKAVFDELTDRQLVVVTIQSEFADARGRHFEVTKDDRLRSVLTTR